MGPHHHFTLPKDQSGKNGWDLAHSGIGLGVRGAECDVLTRVDAGSSIWDSIDLI